MNSFNKTFNLWGLSFLLTAVGLGAFGAHGLENAISIKALATYKTGVTYQFYHGFALLVLSLYAGAIHNSKKIALSFGLGIILFSFNCYLYAITGIKTFAIIIPFGGTAFILGWALFIWGIVKSKDAK